MSPWSRACGSVFRRIWTYGRLVDRVVWPDGESLDLYKIGEILYGLEGFLTFKALSHTPSDPYLRLLVTANRGPDPMIEAALRQFFGERPFAITYRDSLT